MRFILLALAMIGVVFYISNPQAFGAKKKFQLTGNGHVERNMTGGANVDFTKIADFGVDMFDRLSNTRDDSASLELASAEENTQNIATEAHILSARDGPDLNSYEGQLSAIAKALEEDHNRTSIYMKIATQACVANRPAHEITSYFVGLVQAVAHTAQLPQAQQGEGFRSESAALTQELTAWLKELPADERAANTLVLQEWAARSNELVACQLAWLKPEN